MKGCYFKEITEKYYFMFFDTFFVSSRISCAIKHSFSVFFSSTFHEGGNEIN